MVLVSASTQGGLVIGMVKRQEVKKDKKKS